jgi:hypothetical protein
MQAQPCRYHVASHVHFGQHTSGFCLFENVYLRSSLNLYLRRISGSYCITLRPPVGHYIELIDTHQEFEIASHVQSRDSGTNTKTVCGGTRRTCETFSFWELRLHRGKRTCIASHAPSTWPYRCLLSSWSTFTRHGTPKLAATSLARCFRVL